MFTAASRPTDAPPKSGIFIKPSVATQKKLSKYFACAAATPISFWASVAIKISKVAYAIIPTASRLEDATAYISFNSAAFIESNIESEQGYVAVLELVVAPFEPVRARLARLMHGACRH